MSEILVNSANTLEQFEQDNVQVMDWVKSIFYPDVPLDKLEGLSLQDELISLFANTMSFHEDRDMIISYESIEENQEVIWAYHGTSDNYEQVINDVNSQLEKAAIINEKNCGFGCDCKWCKIKDWTLIYFISVAIILIYFLVTNKD